MSPLVLFDFSRRARMLAATAAIGIGGIVAGPATADPISGTGTGRPDHSSVSPDRGIKSLSTTLDTDTGAWSSAVTFQTAQTTPTGFSLNVGLKFADESATGTTWTASTGTTGMSATYNRSTPLGTGPTPPTSVAFNADRTTITLSATDPRLTNRTPEYVTAALGDLEAGTAFSTALAPLGAAAPTPSLSAAAKRLTVTSNRRVRVPLVPLRAKAEQRITVAAENGNTLVFKILRAKYYRRTSVLVTITPRALRHLSTASQAASFEIRTTTTNGSTASAKKRIRIRRR